MKMAEYRAASEAAMKAWFDYKSKNPQGPSIVDFLAGFNAAMAKSDEERQRLHKEVVDLKFIIQDCWPYLLQWCTIETLKNKVTRVLRGEKP